MVGDRLPISEIITSVTVNNDYLKQQSYLLSSFGIAGFDFTQSIDIVDIRGKFAAKYGFGIMQMVTCT